tara:strand:- start:36 stop:590 length:555 start_codon:yes stop_codon:yes gene_type:complete
MTLFRKTLALSAAFAVAVSLFGALATTVNAQTNPPFTAYGTGATSGDEIGIMSGTTSCATATADASGNWGPVQVGETLGSCSFAAGDTISFTLNGSTAEQTETWASGGAPAAVATGTVLSVAAAAAEEPAAEEPAAEEAAPAAADTGNAGLVLSGSGTNSIAVITLAAFAVMMIAGGRVATRTR